MHFVTTILLTLLVLLLFAHFVLILLCAMRGSERTSFGRDLSLAKLEIDDSERELAEFKRKHYEIRAYMIANNLDMHMPGLFKVDWSIYDDPAKRAK